MDIYPEKNLWSGTVLKLVYWYVVIGEEQGKNAVELPEH